EMLDSGNWLVPTFNFQLRDHKPPLLYWLQIAAYQQFGVNEFSARLPSALAALMAVLLTYGLGRLMFGPGAGLLAGLILTSAAMFCGAAHFANPDSLLDALTVATFYAFWRGMPRSADASWLNGKWMILASVCMALAVLAKGPVGLVLPTAVIGLYLVCSRQLSLLLDFRLSWAVAAFILLAVPWYVLVSAETKGEFTRGFFLTHNFGRFLSPMENHRGPIYYYILILLFGFIPWSPFLILAAVGAIFREQSQLQIANCKLQIANLHFAICNMLGFLRSLHPSRFLISWMIVYLVFFSLAGTKLPNYILPIYPAAAILTARFLDEWRRGMTKVPNWIVYAGLAGIGFIGLTAGVGMLLAGGVFDGPVLRGRRMPGLEVWAAACLIPIAGAISASWLMRLGRRGEVILCLTATSALFVGLLAAGGTVRVDTFKAPRSLVEEAGARQTDRDIRIACYRFYQPSLVFYCRREVRVLENEEQVLEFLQTPLPIFLFVSAQEWSSLEARIPGHFRRLASHGDLYKGIEVVVITNQ
ncbi:MAG TPA: glycosyltransferase family 39 protein, partial [Gemmataceae bacterium]|nr:glycosyltransferase family 39 protein [Gemmataceae bacterium]